MKSICLSVVVCLVFVSAAGAESLITNGTFDIPDANFASEDGNVHWGGTGWNWWGNVFRERWAAHTAHAGGFFKGWADGAGGSGLWQNIPSTGGVYTFSAWVRREPAFSALNNLEIKIEWMDSTGTNWVDDTTFGFYNSFPSDALWHHVKVTATGTDANIAFIRPVFYANWNAAGGALSFDDMELYEGQYTGAPPRILNRSFEFTSTNGMRGSQWAAYPDWYEDWGPGNEAPWEVVNWATRAGQLGVAFKGWLTYTNRFNMKLYQNINPGTGTFTFAVWMRRESGFLMTNAGLRIDWYDGSFTNIVSDGASTNFVVPGDTNWYEYYVTGTCTSDAIYEARLQVFADWTNNPGGGDKALRIDDTRFFAGAYEKGPGPELGSLLSHVYFNYTNAALPQDEDVPGLGGTKFFQYNYDPATPSYYHVLTPQEGVLAVRARMYFAGANVEVWRDGAWYTNVVIDSGSPFHGYPAAGAVTMHVWRVAFYPPGNWVDNMWFSPSVRLDADGVEWWCARDVDGVTSGDVWTNDWPSDPQRFWSQIPYDHDFYFLPTGGIPRYVTTDWAYYSGTNRDPLVEIMPTADGTSTFIQVNYATTATTWYVITEKPVRELLPGEASEVLMRTSWNDPTDLAWKDGWQAMNWVSNLVLDAGTPFHGLPAAGSHTVDLWRIVWTQPLNTNVVPAVAYTNQITVYYAPLMKVTYGSHVVDERYLTASAVASNRWGVNNYTVDPQSYGPDFKDHDYFYVNQWYIGPAEVDGIPVWWLDLYSLGHTNGVGAGDDDDDGDSNSDEYAGDTIPNDPDSYFPEVTGTGVGQWNLVVSPSSTGRVYDVWWRTNLLPENVGWTPYGMSVTGNGGAIVLTVTNDALIRFYRTGAHFP